MAADDPGDMACQAARFPGHVIDRVSIFDRVRYVARARSLDAHPYVIVTASLDELWRELTAAQPPRVP
jgi:hypothetical protein